MAYQVTNKEYPKPDYYVPDGEYLVEVVSYEKTLTKKQQHTCYGLKLLVEEKNSHLYDDLILCESMDWKTAAFFKSTKRFDVHGDAIALDADTATDDKILLGARGWARLATEEYDGRDGKRKKKNVVAEWLNKEVPPSPEEF